MTASSQNYLQVYLDSVTTLASTIVVKSEATADGLNNYVYEQEAYTVDTTDLSTWKYYLNISGEYHPVDEVMTVTSLDTLETIDFTKANLLIHTATARAYTYNSRSYLELIARYPTQVMLILGIIYPVDITTAINARDGLILGYPSGLVEDNEYSFVMKLQDFIDGYNTRWVNKQFNTSDELYPAVSLSTMYMLMIPAIITIRRDACGTNEAHSFHVRQYLSSNGNLGDYYDYLTTAQALWLYRNIKYIQRHAGMQSTFDALLLQLMTNRNLPLAEYTMKHDTSTILTSTGLKPTITFERTALNAWAEVDTREFIDLSQLLVKEEGLARDNTNFESDYLASGTAALENALGDTYRTKVLDSSIIDYSDSNPVTRSSLLFYEWLRLSSQGIYTSYSSVTNPVTNETISLSAVDAFAFVMYCYANANGIDLPNVPSFMAHRVVRSPLPSVTDLMSIVDPTLVDSSIATLALSWMPVQPTSIISTDAFYSYVNEIYQATVYQRNLYSLQEHYERRAMVWNLIERIYCDVACPVVSEATTYADWLTARNIHVDEWTTTDFSTVYTEMVSTATGADLTVTATLAQVQAAMVGIFRTLSSYAVQFVTEINGSNIRTGDIGYVRLGNQTISAEGEDVFNDHIVDVQSVSVLPVQAEEWDIPGEDVTVVEQSAKIDQDYPLPQIIDLAPTAYIYYEEVHMLTVRPHPYPPLQENDEGLVPVVGLDYYLALTKTQQQLFKDVYSDNYTPDDRQVLAHIAANSQLTGLVWHQTTEDLSQLTPILDLTGLVWHVGADVDLGSSLLITRGDGLTWFQTVTPLVSSQPFPTLYGIDWSVVDQPLANAALQARLRGLIYRTTDVDFSGNMIQKNLRGLEWMQPVVPLSAVLPIKDTSGLYYKPDSYNLSNFVMSNYSTGLVWRQSSSTLAHATPATRLRGLVYTWNTADLTPFITQARLDGIIWNSDTDDDGDESN